MCRFLCGQDFSLFGYISRSTITDSYGMNMFRFIRNHQIVFRVTVPFCIPTSYGWEFLLLQIHTSISWCHCSGFGHSDRCVVVSHYGFNCIWCEASFHMLICHLYIFFGEVSVKIFSLFLNQVVFLLNLRVLCVHWTRVFYPVLFANIFSQSVACLLILLALSFRSFKF